MSQLAVGDIVKCLIGTGDWLVRDKEYAVVQAYHRHFAVRDEHGGLVWRAHKNTTFERVK